MSYAYACFMSGDMGLLSELGTELLNKYGLSLIKVAAGEKKCILIFNISLKQLPKTSIKSKKTSLCALS